MPNDNISFPVCAVCGDFMGRKETMTSIYAEFSPDLKSGRPTSDLGTSLLFQLLTDFVSPLFASTRTHAHTEKTKQFSNTNLRENMKGLLSTKMER